MRHAASTTGGVTPQPLGCPPRGASQRTSGTAQPRVSKLRLARVRHDVCPGGETLPARGRPRGSRDCRPCRCPARLRRDVRRVTP